MGAGNGIAVQMFETTKDLSSPNLLFPKTQTFLLDNISEDNRTRGPVALSCNSVIPAIRKEKDQDSEASLTYILNSRPSWAIYRESLAEHYPLNP